MKSTSQNTKPTKSERIKRENSNGERYEDEKRWLQIAWEHEEDLDISILIRTERKTSTVGYPSLWFTLLLGIQEPAHMHFATAVSLKSIRSFGNPFSIVSNGLDEKNTMASDCLWHLRLLLPARKGMLVLLPDVLFRCLQWFAFQLWQIYDSS